MQRGREYECECECECESSERDLRRAVPGFGFSVFSFQFPSVPLGPARSRSVRMSLLS